VVVGRAAVEQHEQRMLLGGIVFGAEVQRVALDLRGQRRAVAARNQPALVGERVDAGAHLVDHATGEAEEAPGGGDVGGLQLRGELQVVAQRDDRGRGNARGRVGLQRRELLVQRTDLPGGRRLRDRGGPSGRQGEEERERQQAETRHGAILPFPAPGSSNICGVRDSGSGIRDPGWRGRVARGRATW